MAYRYPGTYEESRGNVQNEIFYRISPDYPQESAISLILSGNVEQTTASGEPNYYVDTDSMATTDYALVGVGFKSDGTPYESTLRTCTEVRIPIQTGSGVDDVEWVRFPVQSRTIYSSWVYLWTDEDSKVVVSGSWLAPSFSFADSREPFDSGSDLVPESLDYTCPVVISPEHSVMFVVYKPDNFEFAGEYNAVLNNAIPDAHNILFYNSGSTKLKKYVSDYHKAASIGGHHAGTLNINQATDNKDIRTNDFFTEFEARCMKSAVTGAVTGGIEYLQTLDLSFMSYRAISASIYVDRIMGGTGSMGMTGSEEIRELSMSIEQVWEDMQEGNVDDPQTVYFIERSELEKKENSNTDYIPWNIRILRKTSIPISGSILFTMDRHTPVRVSKATLYAPFLNRVYRTDEYGTVTELYPTGSVVQ